jgi:uncharacterized protein YdaU (DUF1376 family)
MSYRPPFYKRFPQDYLSSSTTRKMTLAEHGVYNLLLDYAWLEEQTATLPADFTVLARLTGIRKQILSNFVAKYPQLFIKVASNPHLLCNPRLKAEYEEFLEVCENNRLAGLQSARARKEKSTPVERASNHREKELELEKDERREEAPAAPSLSFSGQHFSVTEKQDALLGEAFPWIDRPAEYRKADSWLEANPERRPKKSNRFLHNWFSRVSQPNGGSSNGKTKKLAGDDLTAANLKAAGFVQ